MIVTVVVSAGNDGVNLDRDKDGFKAYCSAPNTICVAATVTSRIAVSLGLACGV